jgi:hypothetical protein
MLPDGFDQSQVHLEPLGGPLGLHVCRGCGSTLMQLVGHEDAGHGHWFLTMRCPECERWAGGRVPDAWCAELDEELERGTHRLLDALEEVQRQIMSAEVEAFVAALEDDLLLPEDF